ncbi:hypothetical protein [uncultured Wocania sp.]|uniref:hypothetical protein n=1 Tax=uncultured Wocania sp. TaxID=2834404 RepID=UPI0030FB0AA4
METKQKLSPQFYQNLGKLFYAIAAADKQVRNEEFDTLKDLVKQQWLGINSDGDEYYNNAVHQMINVFKWLNKNEKLNAKIYFDDFVNYKNEHQNLFTDDNKKLILKTAHAIAISFSGLNKSELMMLAKLDMELKK